MLTSLSMSIQKRMKRNKYTNRYTAQISRSHCFRVYNVGTVSPRLVNSLSCWHRAKENNYHSNVICTSAFSSFGSQSLGTHCRLFHSVSNDGYHILIANDIPQSITGHHLKGGMISLFIIIFWRCTLLSKSLKVVKPSYQKCLFTLYSFKYFGHFVISYTVILFGPADKNEITTIECRPQWVYTDVKRKYETRGYNNQMHWNNMEEPCCFFWRGCTAEITGNKCMHR